MTSFENKYFQLIAFRQRHPLSRDKYGEKHHIMMRSLFPSVENEYGNVIRLSAAEHFKAHYYLWKAYKDELKDCDATKKAWSALVMMIGHTVKKIESEEQLSEAAKMFQKVRSESPHGKEHPAFGKVAWNKGKKGIYSKEAIRRMREAKVGKVYWLKGRHLSDETKKKISLAHIGRAAWNKGKKMSEEFCKLVSENHWDSSGKNNPRYGVHLSDETKSRISKAKSGKRVKRRV